LFNVAVVPTETKLIDVVLHVLYTHMMIDSINPTLENRPKGFDVVGVYVVFYKTGGMVNHKTHNPLSFKMVVGFELVGVNGAGSFFASGVQDF
jgi:hypothetical protein